MHLQCLVFAVVSYLCAYSVFCVFNFFFYFIAVNFVANKEATQSCYSVVGYMPFLIIINIIINRFYYFVINRLNLKVNVQYNIIIFILFIYLFTCSHNSSQ